MKILFEGVRKDEKTVLFTVDDDPDPESMVELTFEEARKMATSVLYNVSGNIEPDWNYFLVTDVKDEPEVRAEHGSHGVVWSATIVKKGDHCGGASKPGHRVFFRHGYRITPELYSVHKDAIVAVCG